MYSFRGYYVLRICMSATFVNYQWPITQMVVSLAASMSRDIVQIKFSSNIFPFYGATVWSCICNVFLSQCFLLYLWGGEGSKVIILSFPSISLSALKLKHAPYILSKCDFSLLMLNLGLQLSTVQPQLLVVVPLYSMRGKLFCIDKR